MQLRRALFLLTATGIVACTKPTNPSQEIQSDVPGANGQLFKKENVSGFTEISAIDIGDAGAAEISAFDPKTKRLFVVNNAAVNKIDVLDFANPYAPVVIGSISVAPYGGLVNSVDVKDGMLAAAIEATDRQAAGKIVIFSTADYSEIKVVTVGSLPDMVAFTPDGKFILTANEGEPNASYTVDPEGTVSIISVKNNFAVVTLNFAAFASQQSDLKSGGLRVFGPNASFAQDMEPEYVTIADDSRTAWVSLQENNAIAKIDLRTLTITDIFPLGFKNYNVGENSIDPSDRDDKILFQNWQVKGMYQPDGLAVVVEKGMPYVFSANEGDAREYTAFSEIRRVSSLSLDALAFPNAVTLKTNAQLARLNVTNTLGNTDGDADFDELYSFGARSFSVWNGNSGALVWDSKNQLDVATNTKGWYDDGRSDDKGSEPEGIAIGHIHKTRLAFIGLERADALAVYDVTQPQHPVLLQLLKTGDAPEGVLFISDKDSPNKRSLVVVSSENDGVIKVYSPALL